MTSQRVFRKRSPGRKKSVSDGPVGYGAASRENALAPFAKSYIVSTTAQTLLHRMRSFPKKVFSPAVVRHLLPTKLKFVDFGGDDKRVLLWQTEKIVRCVDNGCEPHCMKSLHSSNIFTIGFNCDGSALASAGNDATIIVHDTARGTQLQQYKSGDHHVVFEVSYHPIIPTVFLAADSDGRIKQYDTRSSDASVPLARYKSSFYSVQFHPRDPRLFLTGHMNAGVTLWDMRNCTTCVARYGGELGGWDVSCARFNAKGDRVLMLRNDRAFGSDSYAMQLFDTYRPDLPLYRFGDYRYANTATMKSCCFAGASDEYVCAGGDKRGHFSVFMWRIPRTEDDAKSARFFPTNDLQHELHALRSRRKKLSDADRNDAVDGMPTVMATKHCTAKFDGYRSITNQVRFDRQRMLLATSGVENTIKIWSPFPLAHASPLRVGSKLAERVHGDGLTQSQPAEDGAGGDMSHVYALFDLISASRARRAYMPSHGTMLSGVGGASSMRQGPANSSIGNSFRLQRRIGGEVVPLTGNVVVDHDDMPEDYDQELLSPATSSPVPLAHAEPSISARSNSFVVPGSSLQRVQPTENEATAQPVADDSGFTEDETVIPSPLAAAAVREPVQFRLRRSADSNAGGRSSLRQRASPLSPQTPETNGQI